MIRLRRLTASIVALIMICSCVLTGCHGSRSRAEFEVPEEFDVSRDYEITFWAKNDTNKTQTAIYEKAISDFEKLYPNIKVNLRLYTDYGRIYNDVITNISTNTTPNVCITYPDHIATYITGANSVVPLDDLMENEKYGLGGNELKFDAPAKDEIISQYLDECILAGKYYALPYMRSTEACYINKDFVEKLGYEVPDVLTWDFIWEVSDAAAAKSEDGTYLLNDQKVMIPFIYKSTDNMMIQMLRQKDAGYSAESGEILIFNDTTEELLLNIAEHVKNGAFSTFKISSYPANFLNAGQCVFAVDSTAGATWMGTYAPLSDIAEDKFTVFDTEVRMIPQFDAENPKMISQGPSVCIFNKDDSQEVLASWLFTQYLLTNEIQILYSQTEGYAPVTLKAQESEEYKDYLLRSGEDNDLYYDVKLEATKLILDNVDNAFVTPVFNGSASLRDAAGQMIENVTKSVNRKQTVDEQYISDLYEDMTALYRLNQTSGHGGHGISGKADLGPLPTTSCVLIGTLAAVWVILGVYMARQAVKNKKNR